MKLPRIFLFIAIGMASVGLASAASYSTNFENYNLTNLASQNKGWVINDPTSGVAVGANTSGWNPAFGFGTRAASLGFVAPVQQSTVYVSHPASVPLVGNGYTTFSVMFNIVDSDTAWGDGAESRDVFGFRLADGSGNNMFSLFLTPTAQVANPENVTAFHNYSWSTGNGPQIAALAPPDPNYPVRLSAKEGSYYTVTISFITSGDDVNFTGNINGDVFGGTLPGLAGDSVEHIGAFMTPTIPLNPGSNQLIFDNISMVPETSSALLGLLGASLALVRRRRI